ncbi:MAG: hypothetical protein HQL46_11895, partial [Gammaproteobacteria bacterium]|nr:hypothetical protein [Gammaproteobacteria bacterium]
MIKNNYFVIIFCCISLSAYADESKPLNFDINYNIEFSSGYYGQADKTEIINVPITLTYHRYPWKHKL